eukprot:g8488.t1
MGCGASVQLSESPPKAVDFLAQKRSVTATSDASWGLPMNYAGDKVRLRQEEIRRQNVLSMMLQQRIAPQQHLAS